MNAIAEKRNQMVEKIQAQGTQELIDGALLLKDNVTDAANLVMELITNELMDRMPENDFVELYELLG